MEYKNIKFEATVIPQKGYDLSIRLYDVAPKSAMQDWIDAKQLNYKQFHYHFNGNDVDIIIKSLDGLKGNGESLDKFIKRAINSYLEDKEIWIMNYNNKDGIGQKR